jgi:hypothetical protein
VYAGFKQLAGENGYTVTVALEKFMVSADEFGLFFLSTKTQAAGLKPTSSLQSVNFFRMA